MKFLTVTQINSHRRVRGYFVVTDENSQSYQCLDSKDKPIVIDKNEPDTTYDERDITYVNGEPVNEGDIIPFVTHNSIQYGIITKIKSYSDYHGFRIRELTLNNENGALIARQNRNQRAINAYDVLRSFKVLEPVTIIPL